MIDKIERSCCEQCGTYCKRCDIHIFDERTKKIMKVNGELTFDGTSTAFLISIFTRNYIHYGKEMKELIEKINNSCMMGSILTYNSNTKKCEEIMNIIDNDPNHEFTYDDFEYKSDSFSAQSVKKNC